MKKITFLIGNGFNFFVSNYLSNLYFSDIIDKKLKDTKMTFSEEWKVECNQRLCEYCHLLDDISLAENSYNQKGEFLLSELSKLCKKINNDIVMDSLEKSVSDKIKNEMQPMKNSNTSIPKTVRTLFNIYTEFKKEKSFAICFFDFLGTLNYESVSIFTTNYDRIIDELFEDKRKKNKKFHIDIQALHGDYDSNVICCSPTNKLSKINKDLFSKFTCDIQGANVLIIFGMGLNSDPHILKELNALKNKKIIIIEPSPNEYIKKKNYRTNSEIGYDFLFNNEIHFISTKDFLFMDGQLKKPAESPEGLYAELTSLLKLLK